MQGAIFPLQPLLPLLGFSDLHQLSGKTMQGCPAQEQGLILPPSWRSSSYSTLPLPKKCLPASKPPSCHHPVQSFLWPTQHSDLVPAHRLLGASSQVGTGVPSSAQGELFWLTGTLGWCCKLCTSTGSYATILDASKVFVGCCFSFANSLTITNIATVS